MPTKKTSHLTIGEAAERSGVSTSTLRFYESRGLISAERTAGNQRRYHRSMLRRISVIRVAQNIGLTLQEISDALAELPDGRTPTKRDWEKLAKQWRDKLDDRILQLERMRRYVTQCIGCGCLSLKICALYNQEDHAGSSGQGPRYVLDELPDFDNL